MNSKSKEESPFGTGTQDYYWQMKAVKPLSAKLDI
jgi:hypothetical protein